MQCPDPSFLTLFARDPDTALDDLPFFEEHLSECEACRHAIERLADDLHGEKPWEMVLGSDVSEANPELPLVPGYRLIETIRSGGSGTVYRGVHLASGRSVAVKVIQSVVPSHWKRIVLERESLVQCDHPNIVTLLDYGQISGGCFFVTRWMEQSLADYITKNPIVDLRQAIDWMKQIADAVQHVHNLGIVHRDLKPSNVLLNSTGRPKLTDFGIAKQVLIDEGLTTTAAPIGTPGYMAPEQTGRMDTPVGFATDVYGLGAVLYTVLTGRPPFLGGNPVQVLDQVVAASPISPRKLRTDVPVDLERICLKCLEKLPADRYESATDLIEDMNRFADGVPVKARPVWAVVRWARMARRQPVLTSLVGLVGLVLLLAAIGAANFRLHTLQLQRDSEVRSVLQSIATSSPDRIDSLLSRLSEMDSATVNEQISLLTANDSSDFSSDLLTRLRWSCGSLSANSALNHDELQQAVVFANVQELPVLLAKLRTHPVYSSTAFRKVLLEAFGKSETEENLLAMVSLRATLDEGWVPESPVVVRILSKLSLAPPADASFWSRALEPISTHLLHSLKSESTTTDKSHYWKSESIQSIAWQWSRKETFSTVQFVREAPVEALKFLVELPEESRRNVLQILNEEFRTLQNLDKKGLTAKTLDSTIARLAKEFDGLLTERGGIFKRVSKDQLTDSIPVFTNLGWCPSQLHPFNENGVPMFSLTVERSSDRCEVEFDVPVSELPTRMLIRRRDGFEATYLCTLPTDLEHATVIWRQGEWKPTRLITNEDEAVVIAKSLYGVDNSENETQVWIHYFDMNLDDRNDVCLGLRACRKSTPFEIHNRRHFDQQISRVQGGIGYLTQSILESSINGHSYVQVSETESRHDELVQALVSVGATPVYIEIETEPGLCHSIWRLSGAVASESKVRSVA